MKVPVLTAIFCFGLVFYTRAQVQNKVKFSWQTSKTKLYDVYFKSRDVASYPLFPLKKDLSLKYAAPKLPFFCSLEEKSRSKFGLFLKLRVGNDDEYRKLSKSSSPQCLQ